uniref:Uncharacterized protein n=1 Tax=Cacopsylla melanoneura TaxID=428564 RepID=A0A8D8YXN2_9HEMI
MRYTVNSVQEQTLIHTDPYRPDYITFLIFRTRKVKIHYIMQWRIQDCEYVITNITIIIVFSEWSKRARLELLTYLPNYHQNTRNICNIMYVVLRSSNTNI